MLRWLRGRDSRKDGPPDVLALLRARRTRRLAAGNWLCLHCVMHPIPHACTQAWCKCDCKWPATPPVR